MRFSNESKKYILSIERLSGSDSELIGDYSLYALREDLFELIGGYRKFETASNVLQVARYFEETAKGKRIAIIGVSDAHGCQRS